MKIVKFKKRIILCITVLCSTIIILNVGTKLMAANPNGEVYSSGSSGDGVKTFQGYYEGGHQYMEWGGANGSGADITVTSNGKSVIVQVFEDQYSVNVAKREGLCETTSCATATEVGLTGTRDTWAEQIEDAGNKEGLKGDKFDYSDPISLYTAREALKLRGYDNVDKMSREEVENEATKIAQNSGSFSETDLSNFTYIDDTYSGKSIKCSSGNCPEGAIRDGYVVNAIRDFKSEKSIGHKEDGGSICSVEECPNEEKKKEIIEYKYEQKGDLKPYKISAETCSPSSVAVPEIPEKPIPQSPGQSGGGCGSVATNVTYHGESTGCGLVTLLVTTSTTAYLPSVSSTQVAGRGFNWGDVNSYTNVSSVIYDTSKLTNKVNQLSATIQSLQDAIECNNGNLKKLTDEYNKKHSECQARVKSQQRECNNCRSKDCGYDECETNLTTNEKKCTHVNKSCECGWSCGMVNVQQIVCDNLTRSYNENKEKIEKQIENLEKDISTNQLTLIQVQNCGSSVSTGKSKTSVGTVSLVNKTMNLGSINQSANSVKGISKNSGDPINNLESDLKSNQNYIANDSEFFIPLSVANGTKGSLDGNLVGDISMSYSCPIDVINKSLCTSGICSDKTDGNLNLIYRPISLINPFPNIKNNGYRDMGSNWTISKAKTYIENNRSVNDYEIYQLKPVYTITLTPNIIKEIRTYNKSNSLSNFDMTCENGYLCRSNFLWHDFSKIIDSTNSCASYNGWDNNCYLGGKK